MSDIAAPALHRKPSHALFWSGLENASLAVLSLLSLVFFSRVLTAKDFGLFSIALAASEMLGLIVTMFFHDALIQKENVEERHYNMCLTISLFIGFAFFAMGWLALPIFVYIIHLPNAGRSFAWLGLIYPAIGATAGIVARQRREFRFKQLAIRSILGRSVGTIAGLFAAWRGFGFESLVIQQVVTAYASSLVLWIWIQHRPRLQIDWAAFRDILKFSSLSLSAIFLNFSIKRIFVFFVGIGIGATDAGYLNLGFRVVDMLWAIMATAITQVSLPTLAPYRLNKLRLREVYKTSVHYACLCLFPLFTGLAFVAPELIEVVFGTKWRPSAPCAIALSLVAVMQTPRLFVGPVLAAIGRPAELILISAIEMFVMGALIIMLGAHDLWSALLIWMLSEFTQTPVSIVLLWRRLDMDFFEQHAGLAIPLVATLFMSVSLEFVRYCSQDQAIAPLGELFILIGTGVASYAVALLSVDRNLIRKLRLSLG